MLLLSLNFRHEKPQVTELAAWARYRELITTHYAALVIDTETVAHNLTEGPVVAPRGKEG